MTKNWNNWQRIQIRNTGLSSSVFNVSEDAGIEPRTIATLSYDISTKINLIHNKIMDSYKFFCLFVLGEFLYLENLLGKELSSKIRMGSDG